MRSILFQILVIATFLIILSSCGTILPPVGTMDHILLGAPKPGTPESDARIDRITGGRGFAAYAAESFARGYNSGAANSQSLSTYPATGRAIKSKMVDDFEELNDGAIFELDNGQIWKQTSYDYEYHYGYRPDVLIFRDGARYKIKIEGFRRTPTVVRLH